MTHNFEEYRAYRDTTFFWKYALCSDEHVFPPLADYDHSHACLSWELKDVYNLYGAYDQTPAFKVSGFRKRCLTARSSRNTEGNRKPEPTLSGE